jgi:hypothetical protein
VHKIENSEVLCYKDFLAWHRRSGGALVAESDVSKQIETRFGKFYVPHLADLEILSTIKSNIGEEAFLMEIVGVPGVGKTKFLRQLMQELNPDDFESKYRNLVKEVANAYEFCDVEGINSSKQKRLIGKSAKKNVWMTLNIDEFVSVASGTDPLSELYAKLKAGLLKGESLIICGNVGVLENYEAREAIKSIQQLLDLRNGKKVKWIRFPMYESLYWTKEYGVNIEKYGIEGDPGFLVSGQEGFQRYSTKLVTLGRKILEYCSSKVNERGECQNCIGPCYLNYVKKLEQLLEESDLANRLHDLMQYLWLKYPDLYLVARALNIYWGYALTELWRVIEEKRVNACEQIDKSLILASLFLSKLPSIYDVSEYYLSETYIHRLRNKAFEEKVLPSFRDSSCDPYVRLCKRLEYFFEGLAKSEYRSEIFGGVFEEYMEEDKLVACATDIARKLVLMRLDESLLFIPENDERSKELFREPWGFGQLLLASKVMGIHQVGETKTKVPLMIFHESVLNDVGVPFGIAFEEVQRPSYYLTNREKVLRLKLRLGDNISKDLQLKAPKLHVSLLDYASLRDFTRGIGRPDISLEKSTQVKVSFFLDAIEGFVMHEIRPLLWKYLKKDIATGDSSRILVRTLGSTTQRCTLKIEEKEIVIELEGTELVRRSKEVFL